MDLTTTHRQQVIPGCYDNTTLTVDVFTFMSRSISHSQLRKLRSHEGATQYRKNHPAFQLDNSRFMIKHRCCVKQPLPHLPNVGGGRTLASSCPESTGWQGLSTRRVVLLKGLADRALLIQVRPDGSGPMIPPCPTEQV